MSSNEPEGPEVNGHSPAIPAGRPEDSSAADSAPRSTRGSNNPERSWQNELQPLMKRMVVGLTVFFLTASLVQLGYLQWQIGHRASSRSDATIGAVVEHVSNTLPEPGAIEQYAAIALEAAALQQRQDFARALLLARLWIAYVGFLTGMILASVGATFVLGRLEDAHPSEFGATSGSHNFRFKSASPGAVLAVLGTALMVATLFARVPIELIDAPVYLTSPGGSSTARAVPPLNLPLRLDDSPASSDLLDSQTGGVQP